MEGQEIREQFVENKQGYVIDGLNAVAGSGGIGVGEVMGNGEEILGVKYDEQIHEKNDVGDDDELKYVKEVQQSEKKHLMDNVGDGSNSNELAEIECDAEKYDVVIAEENIHNQKDSHSLSHNNASDNFNANRDHIIANQMNEGSEFLNSEPSATADSVVSCPDVKDQHEQFESEKGEDSSSIITNTTNGNSRGENQVLPVETDAGFSFALAAVSLMDESSDLNSDQTNKCIDSELAPSQLNPDAKEFVPNFETNLTSPTSPNTASSREDNYENDFFRQAPVAVPRHIISGDDFVAHSPRKGRGDNMDTIFVPAAQVFEKEADQRPHELEVDNDAGVPEECIPEMNTAFQDTYAVEKSDCNLETIDESKYTYNDSKVFEVANIDVDLCKQPGENIFEKDNDLMKQSIYITNEEAIENVLNSVQPIPAELESVNSSFTEDLTVVGHQHNINDTEVEKCTGSALVEKELLQVEEKEHISKSPSTEEIQICLNSPNKDTSPSMFGNNNLSIMEDNFQVIEDDQTGACSADRLHSSNNIVSQDLFGMEDIVAKQDSINEHQSGHPQGVTNVERNDPLAIVDDPKNWDTSDKMEEIAKTFETNGDQSELCSTPSQFAEEKHLIEETKEVIIEQNNSSIEYLISEMAIEDDIKHLHTYGNEAVPGDVSRNESNGLTVVEAIAEKSEGNSNVADEIVCEVEDSLIRSTHIQDNLTDAESHPVLDMSGTSKIDLAQIEENITNVQNEHQLVTTTHTNDKYPTIDLMYETEENNVNCMTSVEAGDNLIIKSNGSLNANNALENIQLDQQMEDSIAGNTPLMMEQRCKEPESMDGTKELTAEVNSETIENITETKATDVDVLFPDIEADKSKTCSVNVTKVVEEQQPDNSISSNVIIVSDNLVKTFANDECVTAPNKTCLQEDCKNDSDKKSINKNATKVINVKSTPSVQASSKKAIAPETGKKQAVGATKSKLTVNKSSTTTCSAFEKKPAKPLASNAATARKPMTSTTAAPKISAKPNVSSRSTQIMPSAPKTTASKPTTTPRLVSSAPLAARKPATSAINSTAKARTASSSATAVKSNNLSTPAPSTYKPNAASPRATLTSQMRKPVPATGTLKSPSKPTVATSLSKTSATSSLGTRTKPAHSNLSSAAPSATKTTMRAAPKGPTCSTNSNSRRLTVGGSSAGAVTSNTTTKITNARKSSPIKSPSAKTPTKHLITNINSNIKPEIKAKSPNAFNANGGISSNNVKELNVNGTSKEAHSPAENQCSLLRNEDCITQHSDYSNLETSETAKSVVIDSLQKDVIGAND